MVAGDEGSFVGCSDEPVVPYSGDSGVDAGDGASAVVFEGGFPKPRFLVFPVRSDQFGFKLAGDERFSGSRVDERTHLTRDELDKPDGIRVVGSRLEHNRIGAGIRPSLHGGGDRGGVPSDSDIV